MGGGREELLKENRVSKVQSEKTLEAKKALKEIVKNAT